MKKRPTKTKRTVENERVAALEKRLEQLEQEHAQLLQLDAKEIVRSGLYWLRHENPLPPCPYGWH